MGKSTELLKREIAQAFEDGGADEAAELLYRVARSYSGSDPERFTVGLLADGLVVAAEHMAKEYAAGRLHLCEGETLRQTDEAGCSMCVGDWTSARETRSAEGVRMDCASQLREIARSHYELATGQEEAGHQAAAQALEAAANSITSLGERSVPHCPSCGAALVEDGEAFIPGKGQCALCGCKLEVAEDGSCSLVFEG